MSAVSTGDLVAAILEMNEDRAAEIVRSLLDAGTAPDEIIESCREAMTVVGQRFESGEAFIPELIMSGAIMKGISQTLKPLLKGTVAERELGRIVLGTVKGDIHDIGKDIVGSILEAGGFEVVDLGVDVPPESFVEAVRGHDDSVVALSCLLTTGFDSMKATVDALDAAGLRSATKVMLGGAPVNESVCEYASADGWGTDAATALDLAKSWVGAE